MERKMYKIYKITNIENGKEYIGMTGRSLNVRWREHVKEESTQFQKAITKFGRSKFEKEILEKDIDTKQEAIDKELEYVEEYNTLENGYNVVGREFFPGRFSELNDHHKRCIENAVYEGKDHIFWTTVATMGKEKKKQAKDYKEKIEKEVEEQKNKKRWSNLHEEIMAELK